MMDTEEVWRLVEAERRGLADLLAELSDAEWERPSLCPGWRVRDVAAHLTMAPTYRFGALLAEVVRARGNFNRMIHDSAQRRASRPVEQIVADLRAAAGSRRLPPGTAPRTTLADVLVHGQDITMPLGRPREMPREAACVAADRVWAMGFPFNARRRLRGFRLAATDVEWTAGAGSDITGPIEAILLLLTGRTVALERLSGDGAAKLTAATRR